MEQSDIKVLMVQQIFPHYREGIFDRMSQDYDFALCHSTNDSNIPQIERHYSRKVKCFRFMGWKYLSLSRLIFGFKPDVIVHEFSLSILNLYICLLYSKLFGSRFIVWGHGYDRKKGFDPSASMLDRVRAWVVRHSDAVVLYSDDIKKELELMFPQQRFFVARNSIQTAYRDLTYHSMKNQREKIKERVGFDAEMNLSFVARLSPVKKVFLLCDLVSHLKRMGVDVVVHVVGDGEDFDDFRSTIEHLGLSNNFVLYGAIYDEVEIAEIIYCSDFVVIPAWLGLTINHAFCYETPVASLASEKHPPEIQFAQDGINAILEPSVEDLAFRLINTFGDEAVMRNLRQNSRRYFEQNLGLENMFEGFDKAIKSVQCSEVRS